MVLVGSYDMVESHDYYRYACNCKVSQSIQLQRFQLAGSANEAMRDQEGEIVLTKIRVIDRGCVCGVYCILTTAFWSCGGSAVVSVYPPAANVCGICSVAWAALKTTSDSIDINN